MSLLHIGDIFGKSGRRALKSHLQSLRADYHLSGVVANGENAAGGIGITQDITEEILSQGINLITSGNHVWRHKEIQSFIGLERRLLRPANYPKGAPGFGQGLFTTPEGVRVGVLNLIGRVFMEPLDCPFRAADNYLKKTAMGRDVDAILVDFHGEATSEKVAMGMYLDGRVTAVLGTHTHIPTADHRVLPGGTGYMTDVGMTGCYDGIIGMKRESVMPRFLTGIPTRFQPMDAEASLCGAVVTFNPNSGRCLSVRPVRRGGVLEQTTL
ncbi:MAG: TIGR00282 family metallophosphoesterase [Magnetococcales bacterium]|nr:TIGR00282 family metallophosphoesterase [Magnetococcales bacterium]